MAPAPAARPEVLSGSGPGRQATDRHYTHTAPRRLGSLLGLLGLLGLLPTLGGHSSLECTSGCLTALSPTGGGRGGSALRGVAHCGPAAARRQPGGTAARPLFDHSPRSTWTHSLSPSCDAGRRARRGQAGPAAPRSAKDTAKRQRVRGALLRPAAAGTAARRPPKCSAGRGALGCGGLR